MKNCPKCWLGRWPLGLGVLLGGMFPGAIEAAIAQSPPPPSVPVVAPSSAPVSPSPRPTVTPPPGTPVLLTPVPPRSLPGSSPTPIQAAPPTPRPSPPPIQAAPPTPRPSPPPIQAAPPTPRPSPRTLNERLQARMAELRSGGGKWIQIDLSRQRLFAWEGDQTVYSIIVSTGKRGTPTLPGIFRIQRKVVRDRMRGEDYDVPNVPHVLYYDRGYAIHGAYWHNRFGTPVSHGCTNVAPDHAAWLFDWADLGTPIVIRP